MLSTRATAREAASCPAAVTPCGRAMPNGAGRAAARLRWLRWPGHCLGICLPGSMNGFGTVMLRWRPAGVSTSNSWPSGSANSIGSIA